MPVSFSGPATAGPGGGDKRLRRVKFGGVATAEVRPRMDEAAGPTRPTPVIVRSHRSSYATPRDTIGAAEPIPWLPAFEPQRDEVARLVGDNARVLYRIEFASPTTAAVR
jgi:hypothetical protein